MTQMNLSVKQKETQKSRNECLWEFGYGYCPIEVEIKR